MISIKKTCALGIFVILASSLFAQTAEQLQARKVSLPNGWNLTPAGENITLGDLPLNLSVSHNQRLLAVTNNGQSTQTIDLIDARQQQIISSVVIPKAWYGLAFSADDRSLYVSGGNDNVIYRYDLSSRNLILKDTIVLGKRWPVKISPAGIALDEKHDRLFTVTRENNSLYVVQLSTKKVIQTLPLENEAYTCLLSTNNKELYISLWGGKKVLVYDIAQQKITHEIPVGSNPNEMCMTKNGNYLFVANANDNSVSIIDTKKRQVVEKLNAALFPNAPSGSTSNGVALSEDGKTLYIANADNNCLALFDVSEIPKSKSKGFIPVG